MLISIISIALGYNIFTLSLIAIFFTLIILLSILNFIKWAFKINYNYSVDSLDPLDTNTLNKDLEPLGFAYNEEQDIFFSIMYAWQRKYGYCKAYDEAAPLLSMIIDCEPIYFKYNNKEWLIEFWKGQYGMTTGGEIGIYVANDANINRSEIIYESIDDDDCIPLSYELIKNGQTIITRNNKHWWLTGFKLGEFSKPSQLVMNIEITFMDKQMKNAFIKGLLETGYKDDEISIKNDSVYLTFDKVHTQQPGTKTKLISYIMQIYNKHNCKAYNALTKNYPNTLDKLNFIRNMFPKLFMKAMKMGKTEKLFQSIK